MESDNLIIITATIEIRNHIYQLKLSNTEERLESYISALKEIIKSNLIKKIVFCDNSDFSFEKKELYDLAEKSNKEIEFLSFVGDTGLVEKHGKGSGEVEIIRYVLSHSELIKTVDSFYKVTGRLIVHNIDSIIDRIKSNKNYFIKSFYKTKYNTIYDSVLTNFYKIKIKDFLALGEVEWLINDNDNVYLERVIFNRLNELSIEYDAFPVYPDIRGISGSTGLAYDNNRFLIIFKDILCKLCVYNKLVPIKKFFAEKMLIIKGKFHE